MGGEQYWGNKEFIRNAILCMVKRKNDVYGEEKKYFDAAIRALTEKLKK